MNFSRMWVSGTLAILWAGAGAHPGLAQATHDTSHSGVKERERIVLSHVLPKLDGDHLKATLVEVNYGPGEFSPPHSHPCALIGYVVQGALTQVEGEPEAVYTVGESFYEGPNGVHAVSANASSTEPAKLVAYLICDRDTPINVPVPDSKAEGGK